VPLRATSISASLAFQHRADDDVGDGLHALVARVGMKAIADAIVRAVLERK